MTHFETQYSVDGKKWLRFMDKHKTQADAIAFAQATRNEEIETRVAKVTIEVLDRFDKLPGRKVKPIVLPGLGVIS